MMSDAFSNVFFFPWERKMNGGGVGSFLSFLKEEKIIEEGERKESGGRKFSGHTAPGLHLETRSCSVGWSGSAGTR